MSVYPVVTAEARKVKKHDSQVVVGEALEKKIAWHSEQEKGKGEALGRRVE